MSETLHHRVALTGTLVGEESTHGTEASTIGYIPGLSTVFAEATEENYTGYRDPANGQKMVGMYQGALDVAGSMNFWIVDWRFSYWGMGSDTMDELQITITSGSFSNGETVTNSGTFSATNDGVSGSVMTISSITLGDIATGDTITGGTSSATATVDAFIHDIAHSNDPISLTIEEIYAETDMNESEKYLGMRCADFVINSTRGDLISVDYNMIGRSEETETSSPSTRLATSKSPFIWNSGSVTIDGKSYDNVCDSFSITVNRESEAFGGQDREAHEVIAGNFSVEGSFEMDLPSSAIRTIRRAGTTITITTTFTETSNTNECTITFSNAYVTADPREQPRDNTVVRTTVTVQTGDITFRVKDDIPDYSA